MTPKRPPRTPRPRNDVKELAIFADQMSAMLSSWVCALPNCRRCDLAIDLLRRYDRHRARVERA